MINVQNIYDNEPCKWSLVRYLNLPDRNPGRIEKADKKFVKKLDFKDMKDPVKIKYIHKIKKRIPSTLVFGYENKEKHPISVSKICYEENMLIYYYRRRRKETLCSYQGF